MEEEGEEMEVQEEEEEEEEMEEGRGRRRREGGGGPVVALGGRWIEELLPDGGDEGLLLPVHAVQLIPEGHLGEG